MRGLGGRGGASEGDCGAGVGAERRAEAPPTSIRQPPLCLAALKLWVHELELWALLPGLGEGEGTPQCRGHSPRPPPLSPGRVGEADQGGWGTFPDLGARSARANIQPIFFYGVGGGWGCPALFPESLV